MCLNLRVSIKKGHLGELSLRCFLKHKIKACLKDQYFYLLAKSIKMLQYDSFNLGNLDFLYLLFPYQVKLPFHLRGHRHQKWYLYFKSNFLAAMLFQLKIALFYLKFNPLFPVGENVRNILTSNLLFGKYFHSQKYNNLIKEGAYVLDTQVE